MAGKFQIKPPITITRLLEHPDRGQPPDSVLWHTGRQLFSDLSLRRPCTLNVLLDQ